MFDRRALIVTVALTLAAMALFALAPDIDYRVSAFFEGAAPHFALRFEPWAKELRMAGFVVPNAVAVLFAAALVAKIVRPQTRLFADARALVAILLAFALGPGLVVNAVLKEHWGRPRPVAVLEAADRGDATQFRPWWDPTGTCPSNCSFVSGEVAAATIVVDAAAVLPAAAAGIAVPLALLFAAAVAALRIAFGGHFLSDALFAALFTHLVAIAAMRAMFSPRWPPGRPGMIERCLARWRGAAAGS